MTLKIFVFALLFSTAMLLKGALSEDDKFSYNHSAVYGGHEKSALPAKPGSIELKFIASDEQDQSVWSALGKVMDPPAKRCFYSRALDAGLVKWSRYIPEERCVSPFAHKAPLLKVEHVQSFFPYDMPIEWSPGRPEAIFKKSIPGPLCVVLEGLDFGVQFVPVAQKKAPSRNEEEND